MSMNRLTGKTITGDAKTAQDIADILTTPLGSRIRRRDYGSRLYQLVDAPLNGTTLLLFSAATASALAKWLKGVKLTKVVYALAEGNTGLIATIEGTRTDTPGSRFSTAIPIPLK